MSGMIKLLLVAIIVFSVAASGSWYLQSTQQKDADHAKADHDKSTKDPGHAPAPKKTAAVVDDVVHARPLARPAASPETDRVVAIAESNRKQQEILQNREKQLETREKQLDLVHVEITKEQKKLDALRKDIDSELKIVQEKLEVAEKRATDGDGQLRKVEAQKEDLQKSMIQMDALEVKNFAKLGGIYDKMDASAASKNLQQMIDDGKTEMAVGILSNMGTRQAAAVLGDIANSDVDIAVRLTDSIKRSKPAPK